MMFYNGFNLLVDVTIAVIVYVFSTRSAYVTGYFDGEQDTRARQERA
jgi:hypothetical protein